MVAFADRLRGTLDAAYALGIRRHTASRFEQYLSVLVEAASFSYPQPFPWADNLPKRNVFFEAASQSQQLFDASMIWPALEASVARTKVEAMLGGTPLPPTSAQVDDRARNTLFEFATARALQVKGFGVTLTRDAEDVVARYSDLEPFAVECKRPSSPGSLESNVGKLRRQLHERCRHGDRLGMAVVGIERLLGLGGTTPNTATLGDLAGSVDRTLRQEIHRVRLAESATRRRFFPTTPLGGVLLTTAVFLVDRGGIFTVSQMGLFFTGPPGDPLTRRVYGTLSQTIATV
jgi:hypothetical protein